MNRGNQGMRRVTSARMTLAAGSFVLAVGFLAWACVSPPRVRELDERFRMLGFKVSRGTNHSIWLGNPLEAEMRARLRKLHLPVNVPWKHEFRSGRSFRAVLVRYSGRFSHDELSGLEAELVDAAGNVVRLLSVHSGRYPSDNEYIKTWGLPETWIDGTTSYDLRISLREGKDLAVVDVGKLE